MRKMCRLLRIYAVADMNKYTAKREYYISGLQNLYSPVRIRVAPRNPYLSTLPGDGGVDFYVCINSKTFIYTYKQIAANMSSNPSPYRLI